MESSRKFAKKARQVFRRQQRDFWGQALRPRPRWLPRWAWHRIIRFVFKD